jgi:hypothetical protein
MNDKNLFREKFNVTLEDNGILYLEEQKNPTEESTSLMGKRVLELVEKMQGPRLHISCNRYNKRGVHEVGHFYPIGTNTSI